MERIVDTHCHVLAEVDDGGAEHRRNEADAPDGI